MTPFSSPRRSPGLPTRRRAGRSFARAGAAIVGLALLHAGCGDPSGQSTTGGTAGGSSSTAGSGGDSTSSTGTGAGSGSGGAGASGGSGAAGGTGGSGCVPGTCAGAGAVCGSLPDGCGAMLDCGGCFAGTTCEGTACVVPGCSGSWSIGKTDVPASPWSLGGAIDVDAKGRVLVAHAGYFSEKPAGGAWTTSPGGGWDWNTDVVADPSGAVHISAFSTGTYDVSVFTREPGASTFTASVVENVGVGQYQDATSVVVDATGGVHVRYHAGGALHHAFRAKGSATWDIGEAAPASVVAGSTATSANTLAVDPAGGVHMVYFSGFNEVSHAYKAPGGAWTQTSIQADATLTTPPSLALDAAGGVHLLYLAGSARKLRQAYKPAGGAWTQHTLVDGLNQIFDTDLAVDAAGMLHVLYRRDDLLTYLHVKPESGDITFYNHLKSGLKAGEQAKLVVDEDNGVHLAMGTSDKLEVAYRCPGACPAQSCAALGAECGPAYDGCNLEDCGTCSDPTLCGAGGEANVCCVPETCVSQGATCGGVSDGCNQILDCGACALGSICGAPAANQCGCVAGQWGTTVASGPGEAGFASGLALDALGTPHVIHGGLNPNSLEYTTYTLQGWQTTTVDPLVTAIYPPAETSIAVDAQGGLHAAYAILTQDSTWIRYATRPAGSNQWTTGDVTEIAGNIPQVPLAIDPQGHLHLVYADGYPIPSIVHAERPIGGAAWTKTTVAGGGNGLSMGGAGERTEVAIDGLGGVHITYSVTGMFSTTLAYAYRAPGGSFVTEVIEASSTMHPWSSIALDGAGGVHVSYAHWNGLQYAQKPLGGAWSTTSVAGGNYVESDIVVDAAGTVHISYYDDKFGVRDLRYARKPAGGSFTTQAVDTPGEVGRENHMALEASGRLQVTYRDSTNLKIRHAFRCAD